MAIAPHNVAVEGDTSQEQKDYFSTVSSFLLQHTAVNTSVSHGAYVSFEEFKSELEKPWIGTRALEVLFVAKQSQYLVFSKNLLINFQKIDCIFPFHYFW